MAQYQVRIGGRAPLRSGVLFIIIANAVVYLFELGFAYATHFDVGRFNALFDHLSLHLDDLGRWELWQVVSHMWVHDPNHISHLGFNMLVLYFFGPELEARWGRRRFWGYYLLFGLGSAALILATQALWPVLFSAQRNPAIGASGAIAGMIATFCFIRWNEKLHMVFFRVPGWGLLLIFVGIDLIRLASGEPIAVEGHWGGILTAAILYRRDLFNLKLLRLRFKRWRLKRRLRLKRGGKSNGEERYMH